MKIISQVFLVLVVLALVTSFTAIAQAASSQKVNTSNKTLVKIAKNWSNKAKPALQDAKANSIAFRVKVDGECKKEMLETQGDTRQIITLAYTIAVAGHYDQPVVKVNKKIYQKMGKVKNKSKVAKEGIKEAKLLAQFIDFYVAVSPSFCDGVKKWQATGWSQEGLPQELKNLLEAANVPQTAEYKQKARTAQKFIKSLVKNGLSYKYTKVLGEDYINGLKFVINDDHILKELQAGQAASSF